MGYFGFDDDLTGIKSFYQPFQPLPGTAVFGGVYAERDSRFRTGPLASIARLGKGQIAGLYLNAGDAQFRRETHVGRRVIAGLAQRLFSPQVRVAGSQFVQVALTKKAGKTMLNLINMAGNHGNQAVFSTDDIPPLGPLRITCRATRKPKQLTLQPDNKPVAFTYKNNEISFTISSLALHSIVVINE
ncbi:hypothetical protein [Fibrella aquatilis]|uniref:Uncharacterized protein n=1 Tax=Fibrella aquatilis TaxID=2817059 RepID=A0A939JXG4_9BACT|nr:hypothetical protein [Fibrella aquatilis]MBO0932917.1 hypothetical protein [Fibrella aquatilis]